MANDQGAAPAAGEAVDTGLADVSTNWDDMASDAVEVTPTEVAEPAAAPAAPVPQIQEVQPAVATPPAQQPAAPVQPAVQPQAAQPQPQVAPQPAQEPQAPEVPQQPVDMQALRQQHWDNLRQFYTIPQEMAVRLQTEPELVLPEMAANVHMAVVENVMNTLPQQVMQMVQYQLKAVEAENSAKAKFFDAWPELKGHEDAVLKVGAMVRAANKGMKAEEAIQRIGQVVMASLGLSRVTPPAAQTPPFVPQPFAPAGVGGSPLGAAPAQKSEWEVLAEDDD